MFYKKHHFEIIAKDPNSPFFRNYIWTQAFFNYRKLISIPRLIAGIIAQNNDIEYIADLKSWEKTHNELKRKVLSNKHFLNKMIEKTMEEGERLNDWSENNIFNQNLKAKTSKELIKLLYELSSREARLTGYGTIIPILDFFKFSYIENNLKEILKKKVPSDKYMEYFSIFTYPIHNSFLKEQELSLLTLMSKYWSKKSIWQHIKKTPHSQIIQYLKTNQKNFYQALKRHTKKYAWIYYTYNGPAYTELDFLDIMKEYLDVKINPKKKLKSLKEERTRYDRLKKEYEKNINANSFEKNIFYLAGKIVWSKPRRKDYESKSYYHSRKLFLEFSRRLNITLQQAQSIPFNLLKKYLINKKKIDINYINSIIKAHACLPNDNGSITILAGEEAKKYSNTIKRKKIKIKKTTKLFGETAFQGEAKGTVKIINNTADIKKMNHNDILVSNATNPSLISAMKKAAAIITDEGGLTCHAAIVSRELSIPCIVGTKIATQVLKDGDTVKVNANQGIIEIIK